MEWTRAGNGGGDGVMAAVGRTVAGAEEETEPEVEAAELVAAADTAGGGAHLAGEHARLAKGLFPCERRVEHHRPAVELRPHRRPVLVGIAVALRRHEAVARRPGRGKKRPRARAVGRRGCWHEGRRWR